VLAALGSHGVMLVPNGVVLANARPIANLHGPRNLGSHRYILEAVSACRAFSSKASRSGPGTSSSASSRQALAAWSQRSFKDLWRRIIVAHLKTLAVRTLTTNRFRVFSATNQNDFGIVSFHIGK